MSSTWTESSDSLFCSKCGNLKQGTAESDVTQPTLVLRVEAEQATGSSHFTALHQEKQLWTSTWQNKESNPPPFLLFCSGV